MDTSCIEVLHGTAGQMVKSQEAHRIIIDISTMDYTAIDLG